jgi:anti-sigma factor RsiW
MHAVVMDSLEEYLAGVLEPAAQRKLEAHLGSCVMCSDEVRSMQEIGSLFGSLRTEDAPAPSPAFFASVMQEVDRQSVRTPSLSSLFSLDFAFGRRLVFASLLTLSVIGSYLVARESTYGGISPDAVMAQQDQPMFDSAPAQANMLVTLTAYEK